MRVAKRPKVLLINAYFDPWLSSTPTRLFVPRAMAPYYLAGYFDAERVDIKVHDEAYHGTLMVKKIFQWPDIVVITGLTAMFDRARQLAAYFRHWRPGVKIILGGPIPRALPGISRQVFDQVLFSDVGDISNAIDDMLGSEYRAKSNTPRYDLTGYSFGLGSIETSTYCNFTCSFCSLTGEQRPYKPHSLEMIEQQLVSVGKKTALMVLDNNFYGNNRRNFIQRTELIGSYWRRGAFKGWGALVTGDFFKHEKNLELVAKNGCRALFSGVESLESEMLKHFNKRQSLSSDPRSLALLCAKYGIAFEYGMIVDFGQQRMAEIEKQLDYLLSDPDIPLPSLLSMTIPILGTPYFDQSMADKRLLPNLRLSDMDGQKLVEWPLEPIDQVARFVRDMLFLRGRKMALLRHTAGHFWRRKEAFRWEQLLFNSLRPWHQYNPKIGIGNLGQMLTELREKPLTFNAMNESLRQAYQPRWHLPSKFAEDFQPLLVTDTEGNASEIMQVESDMRAKLHQQGDVIHPLKRTA